MQRSQGVCGFACSRSRVAGVLLCLLLCAGMAHGQGVNTAALAGTVLDPSQAGIKGAKVTVTNEATGSERTAISGDDGRYYFVGLPPGQYKVSVDGGSNFAAHPNTPVTLTVGDSITLDFRLVLQGAKESIEVHAEAAIVETTKTEVSQNVEQNRIDNLPSNGRTYLGFMLTDSRSTRDVSPTIGPAPNSGYNVGGARARSNMVSVDGADAGDNSINGIRATISQEGVQEFQLILSNYNAEYGRATGGVINIVTKGGSNLFHGDAFGFFRNKAFQARNAFSGQVDPLTGALDPIKQGYTRTQSGLTLGGPVKKDKTFYFFSYEYTQREETGFSSIGLNNFGMVPVTLPPAAGGITVQLTPDQAKAVSSLFATGNAAFAQLAGRYALFMGSASSVALHGVDFGAVAQGFGFPNPGPGARFPIPVSCPAGVLVNAVQCGPTGFGLAPLPQSFVNLDDIRGNYPVMEKTSLWSGRIDHVWNSRNNSFVRVGVSPSLVTGLPSTSQNQVFGQNSGSRAGYNQSRDFSLTFQNTTTVSNRAINEFRAQYARRGLHFGFSQEPGGDQIGVNIPGYAYFGREPYSTVDRIERRTEFSDNFTLVRGKHTFKMGGDFNLIQLRSKKAQIFELDFGGDVNFGGLSASTFGFPNSVPGVTVLPGTTALQSYGLGIPNTYIQGIGSSNNPFDNKPMGFFLQDNWRLNRHLSVNYGVRYDAEITPLFKPATAVNAAAEQALGVVEGIPRDYNNVAPRFGLAWDPAGNGKTVIRAGYGIFFDHPLLATAFDSATADGGRSVQLLSGGGTPSACGLVTPACGNGRDTPANLNGSSIFQGVLNAIPSMFYQFNQQRFDPLAAGSLFANQNYLTAGFPLPILPFTLPLGKNFVYGYAHQANLTIEHELPGSWKFSLGYQWTRGLHLNRPQDVNSTDPKLLAQNAANLAATGLTVSDPRTLAIPSTFNTACAGGIPAFNVTTASGAAGGSIAFATPTGSFLAPGALGLAYTGQNCGGTLVGFVGTPAFFNFFRPSGPNPSFAGALAPAFPPGTPFSALYAAQVALAKAAGYPGGFGVPVPFNSVDAQLSNGNSWYNALTFNLSKRIAKRFEILSSYTWSHSIDDSTDLQSPLEPQDSRFPNLERSNSVNDQRHRWVTSAVMHSESAKSGDGFLKHLIGDFTVSPIIEFSSGRPFNVITGQDSRLDLGASQARPSIGSAAATTTSRYIPGVVFGPADVCLDNSGNTFNIPLPAPLNGCNGSLGRNRFTMPNYFTWDMRLSRRIPFGERFSLDLIADAFNLFNRTNIAAVNQLCDPTAGTKCTAGQPTASYDARQFQFGLRLTW